MSNTVRYDDRTPRLFFLAAVVWAVVGMLVGVLIAAMLFMPGLNLAPFLTFGRLRPLHTNAVIFAFCGNIIFAGTYHSMQRLLKTRLFSDVLSKIHFWGWQLLIVAAALALVTGHTQGKEYAELPWVLDIVIALLWVTFAVNFFGTIAIRREKHLYVAIWFYIATIVAVDDPPRRQQHGDALLLARELLGLRRGQGRPDAVVVRPQRRRLLPDDAVPRPHVLLPAEGGRPAGLQLPAVDHALLVARLRLHLGGPAPPPLLGHPGVGLDARDALLAHPLDAVLGRHGQRLLHAPRRLAQAARGPHPEVHGRRRHLLRHVDLRRPDDVDQVGERGLALHRLDDRPRPRGRPRLERVPLVRHPLLGGPEALEDGALVEEARDDALLDRDDRPDPLPGLDVGRRHHPVGDVARLRARRPPRLPRLHRDGHQDRPDVLGPAHGGAPLLLRPDRHGLQPDPDDQERPGRLRRGARGERAAAREGPLGPGRRHAARTPTTTRSTASSTRCGTASTGSSRGASSS